MRNKRIMISCWRRKVGTRERRQRRGSKDMAEKTNKKVKKVKELHAKNVEYSDP